MAIARDSNVAGANRGTTSPVTWNHTVASGGVLYVYIGFQFPAADPVSAVTFDGAAMTLIKKDTNNSRQLQVWGILNPTTGSAKAVSVSFSTTGTPTCWGGSVSYTGVNTSAFSSVTPVANNNVGDTNTISTSITTTADNSVVLGAIWDENINIASYTNIVNIGAVSTVTPFETSPLLVTPAGAKTVGFTSSDTDWLKIIAFVAEPPSAGGTNSNFFLFM